MEEDVDGNTAGGGNVSGGGGGGGVLEEPLASVEPDEVEPSDRGTSTNRSNRASTLANSSLSFALTFGGRTK